MSVEAAIIASAGFATVGWMYTARRNRAIARKQHTFNALLSMAGSDIEGKLSRLAPYLREHRLPQDLFEHENDVRDILNHYEFLAASIRNGDIYERLLYDTEHGIIIALIAASKDHIANLRERRGRDAIYEHLEWLGKRWSTQKPGRVQMVAEVIWGRPFYYWPPDPRSIWNMFRV